jgi:predicted phage tail protein
VAPDLPPEAPLVEPSIGSWIIGGTELEGTKAKPAAAAPVTVTSHTTAVRGTTTTSRTTTHRTTTPASAPSVGDATVLPFTGGHVTSLAPTGLALVLGGVALVLASRPRRQPVQV